MVTSVNEGMYTEMDSAGTPIQGIRDTNDFIHSGIIKGLSAGIRGHYAIKNGAYNGSVGFEIVQGNSGGKTTLAVAAGKVFRDGAYNSVATVTFTANSSPSTFDEPSSGTSYFMIVADASNVLKIRGDKANVNSLPVNKHTSSSATDILTGDVPIAIVKMANGGTVDARPIQFLTTDQDEKTVTIGHTTTNAFVEAMSISSTATTTTFENKVSDADIVFQVKDGSSASQEVLRIDAADQRIGINTAAPLADLHITATDDAVAEMRISRDANQHLEFSCEDAAGSWISANSRENNKKPLIIEVCNDNSGSAGGTNYLDIRVGGQTRTTSNSFIRATETGEYNSAREVCINSNSIDIDFRVEGDTATHLLFCEAGTDRVGINTSSPAGQLHVITSNTGSFTILAESDDDDASAAPDVALWRNSATPSHTSNTGTGDDLGHLRFRGNHAASDGASSAGSHDYADIFAEAKNVVTGSEGGSMRIRTALSGAMVDRISMGLTETVFNEGQNDLDFRIETDNHTHAFFVDAGDGEVEIAKTSGVKLGFFGATPQAQIQGVGVDIASVHGALVAFGLITP